MSLWLDILAQSVSRCGMSVWTDLCHARVHAYVCAGWNLGFLSGSQNPSEQISLFPCSFIVN